MKQHTWASAAIVLGTVAVSVAAAACGGGDDTEGKRENVSLGEYSIKPAATSVPAGKVTFVVKDTGALAHELVVLKTDLAPQALKMLSPDKVDQDGSGKVAGEVEDVKAGTTAPAVTLDLSPGKYVLLCNVEGHYALGMATAFEVK